MVNRVDTLFLKKQILIATDTKASGVGGGSSIAGTQTRTFSSVFNSIEGASAVTNTITLPAGTYYIFARVPYFGVNRSKAYLYNSSDSTVAIPGSGEDGWSTSASDPVTGWSIITGIFTIGSTKNFQIRQYTEQVNPTIGLGNTCGDPTNSEVYTQILIEKV